LTVTRIPFANVACRDDRRTNEDASFRQHLEIFCAGQLAGRSGVVSGSGADLDLHFQRLPLHAADALPLDLDVRRSSPMEPGLAI